LSGQIAPAERTFLLNLARATLVRVATNGGLPEVPVAEVPRRLTETNACFVTLTHHGSLRGCIGHILPRESLYQAVIHNAQNAATRDPRFLPVTPDEVDALRIEISVLTTPEPLVGSSPEDLLNRLQPSEHGVVLRIGARGATFLPQVWAQIPDKVEFMNRLSQKAGCPPSAWRGPDASVSIYRVEAFEEPD
jgi:AmmeMemoRadiSam system protein A